MGCVTPGRRAEQNSRKGAKPCERQKRREHGFAPVAVSYFCAVSSADRPAFGGRLWECTDKEADYIKTIEDGGCQLTRLTDEQRQAFRDSTAGCLDFFKANYNPVIPVDDVLAAVNESNARFPG